MTLDYAIILSEDDTKKAAVSTLREIVAQSIRQWMMARTYLSPAAPILNCIGKTE